MQVPPPKGPNSLPFSDFDLRATSLEALRKLDIVEPTPIQAQAIPIMLEGADIIAQAAYDSAASTAYGSASFHF